MGRKYRACPLRVIVLCILCLLFLGACGKDGETAPTVSGTEAPYQNLSMDEGSFYDVAGEADGMKFLAMLYYQEEPVQLWASGYYEKRGGKYVDIFLYEKDGTSKNCLKEIDKDLGMYIKFMDADGCFYSINGNTVTKLEASGRVVYTVSSEDFVREMCQLPDGRLFLLLLPGGSGSEYKLAELDEKGNALVISTSKPLSLRSHIGNSPDGLLLMEGDYVYQVDLEDGRLNQLLSFRQTSYASENYTNTFSKQSVRALRMTENGELEVLKADTDGKGSWERLGFAEPEGDKTPIVLRSLSIGNDSWLKEQIARFNSASDKYYVVIETAEEGEDREAFVTATGVKIATGKGVDLIQGANLMESVSSLIDKGALENLGPWMKQSGLNEEDYFSAAFDLWRQEDRIYSICCKLMISEDFLSADVLGDMENPDVEAVVDGMLSYQKQVIYEKRWSASAIVRQLLQASETMFGMVDWEKGTCDFDCRLFAKILEAAKAYQYDKRNDYPEIAYDRYIYKYGFHYFETMEEVRARGYTVSGALFDDGCHPYVSSSNFVLAMCAGSEQKEGAWEFLDFLLSDGVQAEVYDSSTFLPVKRNAFQAAAAKEMENLSQGNSNAVYEGALTRERVDEMVAFIEDARALPIVTEKILGIICEEAQDYFNDLKTVEEVIPIIENRVQLYLNERN